MRCEMRKRKNSSTPLGVTSTERKAILEKLSTIENLLKKKDDKPLTFKEACAYLGYAPSYLYKLTYRKVIPYYKPTGKMIFFSKSELDEWIFRSRNQNSEISSKNENEGKINDPNQVDMFEKSQDTSAALSAGVKGETREVENEIVIEFPLKSRQKNRTQI